MDIIVCAKQIQATYARTGKSAETLFLNPEDHIHRVNPYDEAAMALAVKVKRAMPAARITVITLAPMKAEEDLWRLMGMGADRLCRIDLTGPEDAPEEIPGAVDSWAKARVLTRAVKTLKGDLVLCGKASLDRQNGLVPAYMAHLLHLPFLAGILDLKLTDDHHSRITKNAGRGRREIVDCRLPALFSVDLPPGPTLKPAYTAIQSARRKEIIQMVCDTYPLTAKTRILATATPRPRPKPIPAPDSALPSFVRIKQLLSGSVTQKKGRQVTGSAERLVEKIINFMEHHGVLPRNAADKAVD